MDLLHKSSVFSSFMSMFWSTAPSTGALAPKLEEETISWEDVENIWKYIILKMGHSQPAWESEECFYHLTNLT